MREMERGMQLAPENRDLKLEFAMLAVYMPFFVGKIDKGLQILEDLAGDESLPDSVHRRVQYLLGFGYRKKGNAVWAGLVKEDQASDMAREVHEILSRLFGISIPN